MTDWMRFGAAALATWRVTHLLANEDGPADVIVRARERLGESQLGAMMDCFQCVSIWVAAPFALYVARKPADRVVAWLALSGAACVLDELATYKPQSEGAFDELLRAQTSSVQGLAVTSPRSSALSAAMPIRAVGRATGDFYEFSTDRPERDVDARDAVELLKTPDFVLATRS